MVHELQNLDRYIKLCGSRYAATLFVGKKARELAEKYARHDGTHITFYGYQVMAKILQKKVDLF